MIRTSFGFAGCNDSTSKGVTCICNTTGRWSLTLGRIRPPTRHEGGDVKHSTTVEGEAKSSKTSLERSKWSRRRPTRKDHPELGPSAMAMSAKVYSLGGPRTVRTRCWQQALDEVVQVPEHDDRSSGSPCWMYSLRRTQLVTPRFFIIGIGPVDGPVALMVVDRKTIRLQRQNGAPTATAEMDSKTSRRCKFHRR